MSDTGTFENLITSSHFVVTAALSPPDSADREEVYSRARVLDGYVDAVSVPDNPGASRHMSSVAACALLERSGYTTIAEVSGRDRNRLAIQADVLGAAALGIANIMCRSGEDLPAGDQPDASPVFDLDSLSMIETLRTLRDESRLLGGRPVTSPPKILIGGALNPFVRSADAAAERLATKSAAGAAFVQTLACFDVPRLAEFMDRVRERGLHEQCAIFVGVTPLESYGGAIWLRESEPRVHIPDDVLDRLRGADRPKLEGRRLCMELIQQIREIGGITGVHVTAPGQEEAVAEIVDASGVLAGRPTWNPTSRPAPHLESALP